MCYRSLCVLLREILAGAILLPAMDVIADPVSAYRDVKDDTYLLT